MNKLKLISAVVAVAAIAIVGLPKVANAIVGDTNNAQCRLDPKVKIVYNESTKKFENLGKNFTYNADKTKATGTFVVSGTNANCKKDVTLASWIMPKSFEEAGYQLKDQKLYNHTTRRSLGRGTHTITVNLPKCNYWQIDMLEGTQATADDGSADYGFGKAHMLDTAMGGQKCEPKPPKPEVCPLDPSMKKDDPNCKVCPHDSSMTINDKDCKETPVTPAEPTPPATPVTYTKDAPVSTVPNTGAGSVLSATLGISSISGLAYSFIDARRKAKALK